MARHEIADRACGDHHDHDGDDDCQCHHREVVGHAGGGDDRVEREDDVDEGDLHEDGGEARGFGGHRRSGIVFEFVVDFLGGFPD